MKQWLCIFVYIGLSMQMHAQSDSTTKKVHSPKTATILSTACPGLGQIYNRSIWKVPIIYAGFYGLGYGANYYNKNYKEFQTVYNSYRTNYSDKGIDLPSDTTFSVFGVSGYYISNVKEGRDYYRRNRDLCLIGMGTWYVLNILEAYVYANLFDFDTDDNLSFIIAPMQYTNSYKPQVSVNLRLRF